jgi:hypothetical protein
VDQDITPGPCVAADERVLPPDPAFANKCMAALARDAEALGWRYGRSVLSRSDRWGWVWRVDIVGRNGDRPRIVLTWQDPADAEHCSLAYFPSGQPPLP